MLVWVTDSFLVLTHTLSDEQFSKSKLRPFLLVKYRVFIYTVDKERDKLEKKWRIIMSFV